MLWLISQVMGVLGTEGMLRLKMKSGVEIRGRIVKSYAVIYAQGHYPHSRLISVLDKSAEAMAAYCGREGILKITPISSAVLAEERADGYIRYEMEIEIISEGVQI